jgi:hypothetical protein
MLQRYWATLRAVISTVGSSPSRTASNDVRCQFLWHLLMLELFKDWQPNSFNYPLIIALVLFLYFAFILGRIALILQNPLLFTSFFRNFDHQDGEITSSRQKKK